MSLQACAEIVKRGDPDRFLAAMAAAPEQRVRLFPIYAFNVEVARAPWVTSEPAIAEIRLQWWHDALGEIGTGQRVRRHEVVTPLAEVIDPAGARILQAVVEARRWDVYHEPFASEDALWNHLNATGGALMWAAARALGAAGHDEAVRALGTAAGLANWLCAVPALLAAGRQPLLDARPAAISTLAQEGLRRLRAARRDVPRVAFPATRSAWLAGPVLRRAARDPSAVLEGRLEPSEFYRRSALLLRAFAGRG